VHVRSSRLRTSTSPTCPSCFVTTPAAATFEEETNRLRRYVEGPNGGLIGSQGPNPTTVLLTFASETLQVEVEVDSGYVSNLGKSFELPTNGAFTALATQQWDDGLTRYFGPPG